MNAAWHAQNPLPKRATESQRIAWHLEHRQACACRPIPAKLQARMRALAHLERKLTRSAPAKALSRKTRTQPAKLSKRQPSKGLG